MKIAFLCKRYYMNHDVIQDKYGRLYQLPNELSLLGHDVLCHTLNYRLSSNFCSTHREKARTVGLLHWTSLPTWTIGSGIRNYINKLTSEIQQQKPDAIIASSDVLHAILAHIISRRTRVPFFLDLYDNYESFGMCKIPGFRWAYRRALRTCEGVFAVSTTLQGLIEKIAPCTPVHTIESTICEGSFQPADKFKSRQKLGLPLNVKLVGTAGSLSTNRGTEYLYDAFKILKQEAHDDVHLVLAGPTGDNPPPRDTNIIYLGELPHEQIPSFFNALDVAVICMKNDNFGKYAFPQKAYEILSCKTPVVCARVGAIEALLNEYPRCLYKPDNATSLAKKIALQLSNPFIPNIQIPTWAQQAEKIAKIIQTSLN